MKNIDIAFNYLILKDEGSEYVNDSDDSGGPTRWGITLKTYADFFDLDPADVGEEQIEQMFAATAKQIYYAKYWLPLSCDHILDLGFAIALFTSGVLYGPRTIAGIVQKALINLGATIKLDSSFGEESYKALNGFVGGGEQYRQALMLEIQKLLRERAEKIIAAKPKNEKYRNGWNNRIDRLSELLDNNYLNQFKKEIFT